MSARWSILAGSVLLAAMACDRTAPGSGTPVGMAGNGGRSGPDAGAAPGDAAGPDLVNPNLLGTGELGACNAQGWCWQNPAPAGDLFVALSDDGRYAAGENGIVFQWPDRYLAPAGSAVLSFVQSAADTVWVGGYGLWHYDGAAWIQESAGSVRALSATPSGDLWALQGGVRHLHNGTWALEQPPAAILERKLEVADLIAVDNDTSWILVASPYEPKGPPDAGEITIFTLTGGVWTELPFGLKGIGNGGGGRFLRAGAKIYVVSPRGLPEVYSPADNWAVVAKQPSGADSGLFAASDGGLLASGQAGVSTVSDQGITKISDTNCRALVPLRSGEALCAAADGGLFLIRTSATSATKPPQQLDAKLFGHVPTPIWAQAYVAWGTGPTDVWRAPLEHFDGVKWTSYLDAAPNNFRTRVIDGSAADNVWFMGDQEILRYDGTAFHVVPLPGASDTRPQFVSTVHTLAPDDTWAVCGTPESIKVWHFDGAQWADTLTDDGGSFAYSRAKFVGGGSQPLWAAVGHGLYRRDGNRWTQVQSLDGYSLVDFAVDGTDVWALGQDAVYQLVGDSLVARGVYSGGLESLALTEKHVWHFWGTHARTLLRQP